MTAKREGQQVDTLPSQMYGWTGTLVKKLLCSAAGVLGVYLIDSSGTPIDDDNPVPTTILQDITTSTNNFTVTNLASGATFTGVADETLGINGIQVFHASDQDCTVYIDQSIDDAFPASSTVTDSFDCLANIPCTRTYTSVSPYYRLRVTNNGASSTTSLSTFTGMTPVINPLPRSLTDDDRLAVESTLTGRENEERHVFVSPLNALTTNTTVRLVGTNFDGTTKDTNFWTETVANGGTVTQAGGEIQLNTGTATNGTAKYETVQRARFVVSRPLRFFGFFALTSNPVADNTRRIGAYDADNGFFFQISGTAFAVGSRRATSDTLVTNGNLNGNYGPTWNPVVDTYYRLEIEYGSYGTNYYVDGKLLHKLSTGHWSNVLSLPITMENNNTGSSVDSSYDCLGTSITGQGELRTEPVYKYISGAASTLCKVGAGDLHAINITNNSGSVTVYDGTSAAGVLMSVIDTLKVQGSLQFHAPFNDGLFIVSTGSAIITVTYE